MCLSTKTHFGEDSWPLVQARKRLTELGEEAMKMYTFWAVENTTKVWGVELAAETVTAPDIYTRNIMVLKQA